VEAHSNTTAVGDLVESPRAGLRQRLADVLSAKSANGAGRNGNAARDDIAHKLEEQLDGTEAIVLHHRRLPGKAGEVSHLIVAPAGITVVDARNYRSGRARIGHGGLKVGRRNRSDLIQRVFAQVDELYELLADTPYAEIPIEAALAWRDVEGLPILHSFIGPRILVCGIRKIAREAARPGPLTKRQVNSLSTFLQAELPGA
jgi:hypothetical protein